MTTILAIDASTGPCSVAVWHGGHMAAYVETLAQERQSARLMPMVEEALHTCRLTYRDLTRVAATIGPGSFTGIRVGLAAARGVAFAAGIPCAGHTTLEVLAFAARERAHGKPILAVLNAGKGEVYSQLFSASATAGAPEARVGPLTEAIFAAAQNGEYIAVGNVSGIGGEVAFPRADALAALAAQNAPHHPPSPLYIRPPDAKVPMPKP